MVHYDEVGAVFLVYSALNFIGFLVFGNSRFKGYTKRSYMVGCIHEAILLPAALVISLRNAPEGDLSWRGMLTSTWATRSLEESMIDRLIQCSLIGYLGSDFSSLPFDTSLVIHHFLSGGLALLALHIRSGAGLAALGVVFPEFGSLWLNICDFFPSRAAFVLRFFFYVFCRLVATVAGVFYCIGLAETNMPAAVVVGIVIVAVLAQNSITMVKMAKSLVRAELKRSRSTQDISSLAKEDMPTKKVN